MTTLILSGLKIGLSAILANIVGRRRRNRRIASVKRTERFKSTHIVNTIERDR